MNATAIILAAGEPRQMSLFQPMLKLNGKSVIRRQIEAFRMAGVQDILIVTGYHADDGLYELASPGILKALLGDINTSEFRRAFSDTNAKVGCVYPGNVRSAWISSEMTKT